MRRARVQEQRDPEEAPQSLRRVQLASVKIQVGFRMHLELGPGTILQPSTPPLVESMESPMTTLNDRHCNIEITTVRVTSFSWSKKARDRYEVTNNLCKQD